MEEKVQELVSLEEMQELMAKKKQAYFNQPIKEIMHLNTFNGIYKFRSVARAIKRGLVSIAGGYIYPKRPYNNRANTSKRKGVHSRAMNEVKKGIYARTKHIYNAGL